jgi:hypothetical protein
MPVLAVSKFERFFRVAASLEVDKSDIKRYSDFIQHKVYDLLVRAEAVARANDRGMIEPFDLPITKGLQETMHQFERLDEAIELEPILEQLAAMPELGMYYSDETTKRLPDIVGGLSVALARSFNIIQPGRHHPGSEQWEQAFRLFDLLI